LLLIYKCIIKAFTKSSLQIHGGPSVGDVNTRVLSWALHCSVNRCLFTFSFSRFLSLAPFEVSRYAPVSHHTFDCPPSVSCSYSVSELPCPCIAPYRYTTGASALASSPPCQLFLAPHIHSTCLFQKYPVFVCCTYSCIMSVILGRSASLSAINARQSAHSIFRSISFVFDLIAGVTIA